MAEFHELNLEDIKPDGVNPLPAQALNGVYESVQYKADLDDAYDPKNWKIEVNANLAIDNNFPNPNGDVQLMPYMRFKMRTKVVKEEIEAVAGKDIGNCTTNERKEIVKQIAVQKILIALGIIPVPE
jgi:hypothetical protein